MTDRDSNRGGGVLCVFAHPDDEEYGTSGALLTCVERGIPVDLLTATSGEAGEISDSALATAETLGAVREAELARACEVLGIHPPILLRHPDGHLREVDSILLRDRIVEVIRHVRPQVVVTFDANGGYGHPDHIAIHHATLAAIDAAATLEVRPDLGPRHDVAKVYATAYPRTGMQLLNEAFRDAGFPPIDFGDVQTVAASEIGTADERVTTRMDVERFWETRWRAFRSHLTQYGDEHPFVAIPRERMRAIMAVDSFVRLKPPLERSAMLPDENDIWAGLPMHDFSGRRDGDG